MILDANTRHDMIRAVKEGVVTILFPKNSLANFLAELANLDRARTTLPTASQEAAHAGAAWHRTTAITSHTRSGAREIESRHLTGRPLESILG